MPYIELIRRDLILCVSIFLHLFFSFSLSLFSFFTSFGLTEKLQRARQMAKSKKDSCPFCKEEKKRPLNAYMRKRSQDKSSDSKICEESDEEEQTKCCPKSHNHQAVANKWPNSHDWFTTVTQSKRSSPKQYVIKPSSCTYSVHIYKYEIFKRIS